MKSFKRQKGHTSISTLMDGMKKMIVARCTSAFATSL